MSLQAGRHGVSPVDVTSTGKIIPSTKVPSYSASDAGKALHAKSDGTYEWKYIKKEFEQRLKVGYNDLPSGIASGTATVNNIIGVTEKTKNKLIYPYVSNDGNATPTTTSKTLNGLTFYVDSNGYVNVSGTATSQVDLKLYGTWGSTAYNLLNGQTGTVVKGFEGTVTGLTSIYVVKNGSTVASSSIATDSITLSSGDYISCVMVRITNGSTVDAKFRVWVELGSSSTGYTPYFSGLKSATITKVISVGKNLVSPATYTANANGLTLAVIGNHYKITGTSTAGYAIFSIPSGQSMRKIPKGTLTGKAFNVVGVLPNNVYFRGDAGDISFVLSGTTPNTVTKNDDIQPHSFGVSGFNVGTTFNVEFDVQIEKGSTATSYVPHMDDELDLPETVTVRSAGTVHDTYTPITGVIEVPTIDINLGEQTWAYGTVESGDYGVFTTTVDDIKANTANLICSCYATTGDVFTSLSDKTLTCNGGGGHNIYIRDDAYNDASAFTTAMSGQHLYAEITTPTTRSVTPITPEIDVEVGGQIGFESEEGNYTDAIFKISYPYPL